MSVPRVVAHDQSRTPAHGPDPVRSAYLPRPERLPRPDADLLRAVLVATDTTASALGLKCGVGASRAGCWVSDDESEASMSLRHILKAPRSVMGGVGRALVRMAEAGVPRAGLPPLINAAKVSVQAGEALQAVIEAGPEVDDAELARIRRELVDVIEAAQRALADLDGGR